MITSMSWKMLQHITSDDRLVTYPNFINCIDLSSQYAAEGSALFTMYCGQLYRIHRSPTNNPTVYRWLNTTNEALPMGSLHWNIDFVETLTNISRDEVILRFEAVLAEHFVL